MSSERLTRGVPLDAVMRERKITNREIARLCHSSESNVSRWRQGRTKPSPVFRSLMCDFLGMTEEELGWR